MEKLKKTKKEVINILVTRIRELEEQIKDMRVRDALRIAKEMRQNKTKK